MKICEICGLSFNKLINVRLAHLPCNLRWITKKDNMIKSSKIPESAYYYPPLWEILVEIGVIE
jgi:hypothetical protein